MSLKIHVFDSHLDFFPENLGLFHGDDHGERFHRQNFEYGREVPSSMESQYDARLLLDYEDRHLDDQICQKIEHNF